MEKVRLRYSKTGRARFISHLDLAATIQRAVLRAGIALKYSEGFNPHPYISVALPLSVGVGSDCELMDIGFAEEVSLEMLPESLTRTLPEGIVILDAYAPARKFADLAWVEISGSFVYDGDVKSEIVEKLVKRFSEESIIISKKTKRGFSDIDIAPFIKELRFSCDGIVRMMAKISAQNPSINPQNILDALTGDYSELVPDFAVFSRVEVFDSEMKVFR